MQRKYLSSKEVEAVYGVNAGTLANWRLYGKGPAYFKVGRLVRYEVTALEEFFYRHRVLTSDQPEKLAPISSRPLASRQG